MHKITGFSRLDVGRRHGDDGAGAISLCILMYAQRLGRHHLAFEVGMLSGRAVLEQSHCRLSGQPLWQGSEAADGGDFRFRTVDYFAVETLTLGITNVWIGMGVSRQHPSLPCLLFY